MLCIYGQEVIQLLKLTVLLLGRKDRARPKDSLLRYRH